MNIYENQEGGICFKKSVRKMRSGYGEVQNKLEIGGRKGVEKAAEKYKTYLTNR